jgi:hypothetical protein
MAVIACDGRPDAALVEKLGKSLIWLLDDNRKARIAFDPRTFPSTFIFGSDNIVRHINRGFGTQTESRVETWLRTLLSNRIVP